MRDIYVIEAKVELTVFNKIYYLNIYYVLFDIFAATERNSSNSVLKYTTQSDNCYKMLLLYHFSGAGESTTRQNYVDPVYEIGFGCAGWSDRKTTENLGG